MNVNITNAEYDAICLAIGEIEINIEEGADEEYIKTYTPIIQELRNVTAKFLKAKESKQYRDDLYEAVKAFYPHENPDTWKRMVSTIIKQERTIDKPW